MNFDFSDDQKFLKSEARKFLEGRCPTSKVRAILDDPAKSYDQGLWKEVAAQGWLGAAIPEANAWAAGQRGRLTPSSAATARANASTVGLSIRL